MDNVVVSISPTLRERRDPRGGVVVSLGCTFTATIATANVAAAQQALRGLDEGQARSRLEGSIAPAIERALDELAVDHRITFADWVSFGLSPEQVQVFSRSVSARLAEFGHGLVAAPTLSFTLTERDLRAIDEATAPLANLLAAAVSAKDEAAARALVGAWVCPCGSVVLAAHRFCANCGRQA